jgi:hypothetical protein
VPGQTAFLMTKLYQRPPRRATRARRVTVCLGNQRQIPVLADDILAEAAPPQDWRPEAAG